MGGEVWKLKRKEACLSRGSEGIIGEKKFGK